MLILSALLVGLAVSFSPASRIIKRHPGLPILFACLAVVSLLTGCTAAWLGAVSAMLPSIVTLVEAIVAFATGLSGKTVSVATLNFIQKVALDIKGEITNAQTLIAAYKNSPDNSTLGSLTAVFNSIVANLGSILSNANITDSATVGKLTQLVGLGVAAVQAVLGLIPLVIGNMTKFAAKEETGSGLSLMLYPRQIKSS
jgi:uncharacterized protein (DUF697 family)